MVISIIEDIEKNLSNYPEDEQLCLFERLAHQLRGEVLNKQKTIEAQLTAMAF